MNQRGSPHAVIWNLFQRPVHRDIRTDYHIRFAIPGQVFPNRLPIGFVIQGKGTIRAGNHIQAVPRRGQRVVRPLRNREPGFVLFYLHIVRIQGGCGNTDLSVARLRIPGTGFRPDFIAQCRRQRHSRNQAIVNRMIVKPAGTNRNVACNIQNVGAAHSPDNAVVNDQPAAPHIYAGCPLILKLNVDKPRIDHPHVPEAAALDDAPVDDDGTVIDGDAVAVDLLPDIARVNFVCINLAKMDVPAPVGLRQIGIP